MKSKSTTVYVDWNVNVWVGEPTTGVAGSFHTQAAYYNIPTKELRRASEASPCANLRKVVVVGYR